MDEEKANVTFCEKKAVSEMKTGGDKVEIVGIKIYEN